MTETESHDAKANPRCPASLFEKLASSTQQHERAWDVGTGNGQAAVMIADHYRSVVATDISEPQLSLAPQRPNITYSKMSGTPSLEELERVVGAEGSVDLVTVAGALHWFDFDKFYPIVKHVLRKPGGVFAAWTYGKHRINKKIDKLIEELFELMLPYIPPELQFPVKEYRTIPFPFEPLEGDCARGVEVQVLESLEKQMTLDEVILLWKSSPAVKTALDQGVDIINVDVTQALFKAWGKTKKVRTVTFPLYLLVGTVSSASLS